MPENSKKYLITAESHEVFILPQSQIRSAKLSYQDVGSFHEIKPSNPAQKQEKIMRKRFLVVLAVLSTFLGIIGCKTLSEKSVNSSTQTQTVIEEFSIEDFAKKYKELPNRLNNYEGKKVKINGYAYIKSDVIKSGSTDDVYLEILVDTTNKTNGEMTCKVEVLYLLSLLEQKKIELDNFYKLNIEATYKDGKLRQCQFTRIERVAEGKTKEELSKSAK
jgi:hypothetical protein